MTPTAASVGFRTPFTALDFAGLDDIGWELRDDTKVGDSLHDPSNTRPVQVNITSFTQHSTPDRGIDDDGEYYARVSINFGDFEQSAGDFIDSTPTAMSSPRPGRSSQTCPRTSPRCTSRSSSGTTMTGLSHSTASTISWTPVRIQVPRISTDANLVDGTFSGESTGTATGDHDDGDGRATITFNSNGTKTTKSQALVVSGGSALTI